ncbi:MAG: VWA domain-containing protein [Acidobacteria bacterium]|nr:VWA domain-containing protein [Acidobacteriota bacterium]NIM60628.1 VWA domain-containing protein [Acidobacteriota bacterium]NIO57915.1 VWA domain-containing protein [Acidobacteriota bacterium]NIQ28918.1 VWA domain-containing protein [Acidobacteriota bacterium]NIQ83392.1 VWA domain-containing protein [Acidobacteriota bacterium]
MFRFASGWVLALLPAAIAVAYWMGRRRNRGDARVSLPQTGALLSKMSSPWVALEGLLPWLRGLILLLLVLGIARPQSGSRIETTSTLGVDIVIVQDTSESMRGEDFAPDNRLAAAKKSIRSFIEERDNDRIGLVAFGSLATTRCPLTLDHEMLQQMLDEVDFSPREEGGTAIGMGLATAVNRLRDSNARSRVVVLLTDGANNEGQIGPEAAAEAAKALGVRVYTIGVGSTGQVPLTVQDRRGRRYVQMQYFELDEELLQSIADTTGGEYFNVRDSGAMEAVFETIDELEKTEIESRERVLYRELFAWMLFPAVGLLFLERTLVGTRLRRIP